MHTIPALDPDFCRARQHHLRVLAEERGLNAILITNRGYVHPLTGYWHRQTLSPVAVLIERDGPVTLFGPEGCPCPHAVDDHVSYVSQKRATLIENPHGALTHHLGHGIGLNPHEVPRLNPGWDDTLEIGDVIAVEPALYGDALNAGIRLEQDYLITGDGAERLSSYPLEM